MHVRDNDFDKMWFVEHRQTEQLLDIKQRNVQICSKTKRSLENHTKQQDYVLIEGKCNTKLEDRVLHDVLGQRPIRR